MAEAQFHHGCTEFISKYSQLCQSSLIPDMEMSFLREKGNQAWSTLPALFKKC